MNSLRRIVMIALLLRAALPAAAWLTTHNPSAFTTPDSARYLELGASLAGGLGFAANGQAENFRTPGYPLLLAVGVSIGHPWLIAIAIQSILGCVIVFLTYETARIATHDRRIATLAGLGVACDPVLIAWTSKLGPETLLTTFVIGGVYALFRYRGGGSWRWMAASAVCCSLAAYAKPIAYFLPIWIVVVAGVAARVARTRRWPAAHAAVFLGISVLILGAWHVRNGAATGYFGFSTILPRALYLSQAAATIASNQGRPFADVRERMREDFPYERARAASGQTYSDMGRRAVAILAQSPATTVRLYLTGVARTLLSPGATVYLEMFGRPESAELPTPATSPRTGYVGAGLTVILTAVLLTVLCFAARALWPWRRSGLEHRLILAGVALYFIGLAGGPWGQSRFRHPAVPMLSTLMACGVVRSRTLARDP